MPDKNSQLLVGLRKFMNNNKHSSKTEEMLSRLEKRAVDNRVGQSPLFEKLNELNQK